MTTYDLFPMNSRMVQRNLKPLFFFFSKKEPVILFVYPMPSSRSVEA